MKSDTPIINQFKEYCRSYEIVKRDTDKAKAESIKEAYELVTKK
ncbi:MAG: hypothetical protein N4A72_17135 [Bacteroidales bacterium]|jgi:hypothetical protein|nr:hypothetical protein [Bacteroidales bacterium]